jgi:hypothetical protein
MFTLLFFLIALLSEVAGTVAGFGSSVFFVPLAGFFFRFSPSAGTNKHPARVQQCRKASSFLANTFAFDCSCCSVCQAWPPSLPALISAQILAQTPF